MACFSCPVRKLHRIRARFVGHHRAPRGRRLRDRGGRGRSLLTSHRHRPRRTAPCPTPPPSSMQVEAIVRKRAFAIAINAGSATAMLQALSRIQGCADVERIAHGAVGIRRFPTIVSTPPRHAPATAASQALRGAGGRSTTAASRPSRHAPARTPGGSARCAPAPRSAAPTYSDSTSPCSTSARGRASPAASTSSMRRRPDGYVAKARCAPIFMGCRAVSRVFVRGSRLRVTFPLQRCAHQSELPDRQPIKAGPEPLPAARGTQVPTLRQPAECPEPCGTPARSSRAIAARRK